MSPKNPTLHVGLAALGLFWLVTQGVADEGAIPAPGPSPSPAPTQSVLLLSDGRVLWGHLSQDDSGYVLRHKLNTIPVRKRDVEKICASMHEVYQYKRSRLADLDPDEHMKLARWCLSMKTSCLSQNMKAEAGTMEEAARTELEKVDELSPGHREARAMIASLGMAAERATLRDTGVVQAGGGAVEPRDRPEELNPAVLRGAARNPANPGPLGLPAIFDLSPALSARRTQEFANFVHPELQKHCAKCHNERSNGSFQLVEARTRRDMTDEVIVRANLEATLGLVDPHDLAKSPLLSSSLMPHRPKNVPILAGPKTPAYRAFATWVYSLQTPSRSTVDQASTSTSRPNGAGFATDRIAAPPGAIPPPPAATPLLPAPAGSPGTARASVPLPPVQASFDGTGRPTAAPGQAQDFPTSPLRGEPTIAPPRSVEYYIDAASGAAPNGLPPVVDAAPPLPDDPGSPAPDPASPKGQTGEAAANKNRKKPTLDPAALEKFLSTRKKQ